MGLVGRSAGSGLQAINPKAAERGERLKKERQ